jgi:hypothetical protein
VLSAINCAKYEYYALFGCCECYRIGVFDRKGRRATRDPSEPTASEDGNVVPLFPADVIEDLVPLGVKHDESDAGQEALGSVRAGAWSEARAAQLLDAPNEVEPRAESPDRSPHLRRGLSISLSGLAGAVAALAAIRPHHGLSTDSRGHISVCGSAPIKYCSRD